VSDATYRVIELTGTSTEGVTEAMQSGVARANQTLRNLDWIEVAGIRGHIADGRIAHYQVSMKVGFRMDDPGTEGAAPTATDITSP
jgi:flavin-binding protein dodecin